MKYVVAVMLAAAWGCGSGGDAIRLPATVPSAAGPTPKVQLINVPGEPVDLAAHMPPGKVTVVDFFAPWCQPCERAEHRLLAAVDDQPAIVVRRVDIAQDSSPVARQHGVLELPEIRIYDARGALRHRLIGADTRRAGRLAVEVARGQ